MSQPITDPAMTIDDAAFERFRLHAEICKVLTDPKRLIILDGLRAGDRSVGQLAELIGVTLANASQHLAVLRSAGLVDGRRSGTTVVYRLAEPAIIEACDVIHSIVERRLDGRAPSSPWRTDAAPGPLAPTPETIQR